MARLYNTSARTQMAPYNSSAGTQMAPYSFVFPFFFIQKYIPQ
jgi:hypothetical protein